MGRKLKGQLAKAGGKGLKAALARHEIVNKRSQKKTSEIEQEKALEDKPKPKPKQIHKNQSGFLPFSKDDRILLVGEGDFSYAASIVQEGLIKPENVIATSFDSLEEVNAKYPKANESLAILRENKVQVYHEVDATNLVKTLKLNRNKKLLGFRMDFIMFNFPHTGRGMKNMDRNIRDHQNLILKYFQNCKQVFKLVNDEKKNNFGGYGLEKEGKILLSLFEGEPYVSWNIKILGRSEDLRVEKSGKFDWDLYPLYHHRRTNGIRDTTKPANERDARTYVFEPFKRVDDRKKATDSDSD